MQQINVIVTPKAKQTISVTVNGVAMSVVNSDGSYSTTHYSGTPFIIPDTIIKNTAGTTVLTQPSCTNTGVIADCRVINSDLTYDVDVPAETTHNLPDIQFTDSDGSVSNVPACKDIVATPSVQTYASAKLMKTGQTTSYRTGDDGDIEAGRENSFFVLKQNNPFGNTNRFTDELGGQTYTNNIIVDWSTFDGVSVLGVYRTIGGNVTWNSAIDSGPVLSVGSFTSGWRLWNDVEMMNFAYRGNISDIYGYSPLLFPIGAYWSSSGTSAEAIRCGYSGTWSFGLVAKEAGLRAVYVRTFTVSGTTLS